MTTNTTASLANASAARIVAFMQRNQTPVTQDSRQVCLITQAANRFDTTLNITVCCRVAAASDGQNRGGDKAMGRITFRQQGWILV